MQSLPLLHTVQNLFNCLLPRILPSPRHASHLDHSTHLKHTWPLSGFPFTRSCSSTAISYHFQVRSQPVQHRRCRLRRRGRKSHILQKQRQWSYVQFQSRLRAAGHNHPSRSCIGPHCGRRFSCCHGLCFDADQLSAVFSCATAIYTVADAIGR
jgi:hypothetical protein